MNAAAAPFERFDLARIAPQRWHNGAGLTREIARGDGAAVDFDWRISVAEVDADAPFSAFPGVDRCIVLLAGAGMRLRAADGSVDHRLVVPFAPFRFSGDTALTATLVDGPCRDLNVMTRRGVFRSEVDCRRDAGDVQGGEVTLVLCAAGAWRVATDPPQPLAPLQGLLWRAPLARVGVRLAGDAGALLVVRLCHDPRR